MASCLKNFDSKNYYNCVILLAVTINNVGDVFVFIGTVHVLYRTHYIFKL